MYEFIDTTEYTDSVSLPSEALAINGEYIENQVSGYRTLYVYGREILAPELDAFETGIRDGSTLKSKRYPARTIVIGFQLVAKSNSAFRAAFNELNRILNVEEAELIFNDEKDKFFIGTPSAAGDVPAGRNAITSEFEILCVDPFKYSVEEYEVTPNLDDGTTFGIMYNGTYKSYPTLEATFASEEEDDDGNLVGDGDCGYVAFVNENEKVIQLGDPDEPDTEEYAKSQTLINQKFASYGAVNAAKWPVNSGRTTSDTVVQTGSVGVKSDGATTPTKMLYASDYGTGNKYHGPSITRTVPADKSGHVGAKNFRLTYKQRLCMGTTKNATKQRGLFQVLCINKDGDVRKIVAGVSVFKGSTGSKGTVRFRVNEKIKKEVKIDLTRHNKFFGYGKTIAAVKNKKGKVIKKARKIKPVLTSSIQKTGNKIVFNVAGIKKTFRDSSITNMEIHEITFVFSKYSDKAALATNGLYWAKLISDSCETFRDIPNKFSADDVVNADCENGEIYLNDNYAPELGALGNDWEEFYLEPGSNQIGVAWSDWVAEGKEPSFKIRYREVFL